MSALNRKYLRIIESLPESHRTSIVEDAILATARLSALMRARLDAGDLDGAEAILSASLSEMK
jgi:hypothetical protein